jgi:uncharacterized iron-regulated protein
MLPAMLQGLSLARRAVLASSVAWLALAGCASGSARPRYVLYGEQHDQIDHQRQAAGQVRALANKGRLGAVVIEMAERGRSTAGVPATASAQQARDALAWNDKAWPWAQYGDIVMAAVAAGVPVHGGNLPRAEMPAAMQDATLDAAVSAAVRDKLARAVADGHCGLLPEAQTPVMVRIQIARDRAMANTLRDAAAGARTGQQVLLFGGAQHAARDRGVPRHLLAAGVAASNLRSIAFGDAPQDLEFDARLPAAVTPQPDHCEQFKQQLNKKAGR